MKRIKEAIELSLEVESQYRPNLLAYKKWRWTDDDVSVHSGSSAYSGTEKLGFEVIRVKGSHHFLKHQDVRCTVVPVHRGETIGRGLLPQILRDCDVTREELEKELYLFPFELFAFSYDFYKNS